MTASVRCNSLPAGQCQSEIQHGAFMRSPWYLQPGPRIVFSLTLGCDEPHTGKEAWNRTLDASNVASKEETMVESFARLLIHLFTFPEVGLC